ncbi:uncharacterized protein LOC122529566 [Frieseomelitta varia]|uniref:uncharacterized protein LOC122529566 n=1 Tax=Frieseomelitta varia TaxID=561572 RepID=UPI001CB6AE86|nr:uncharacterized protein LOC122529566 [Frieseomelitta varia]
MSSRRTEESGRGRRSSDVPAFTTTWCSIKWYQTTFTIVSSHIVQNVKYFDDKIIPLGNIISCATDEAALMTEIHKELLLYLKNRFVFHCVIHRQYLVAKDLEGRLHEALSTVIKAVNYIKSNPSQSLLFRQLHEENDKEHERLAYDNLSGCQRETICEDLYFWVTLKNLERVRLKKIAKIIFYLFDIFDKLNLLDKLLENNSNLENKSNIDVEVEESWKVRKDKGVETVVVKLKERMSKKQIMTRKKNLKTGIYIDDLTRKEREIQGKLRKLAGEKRREGKKITVGCKKIGIDKKWYIWNERKETLEKVIEKDKY